MDDIITPLLTDYYQISMVYAYWKTQRTEETATFEMFFRKNPFGGEFTINAGFEDVINFLKKFKFTDDTLKKLDKVFKVEDSDQFYEYLKSLNFDDVIITYIEEGRVVFPRIPIISLTGKLPVVQIAETTILNLTNFASLIATNASRMRLQEPNKTLLEFGLRRAQGPNGAMTASIYSYLGGFDGTSNVLASSLFGIPCIGTHAHSFVNSYVDNYQDKVSGLSLKSVNLWDKVLEIRKENNWDNTNLKELSAFVSYAYTFPNDMLALVDTYDTLKSGVPNFLSVAIVLKGLGYDPKGVRLDSGDLAYLSKEVKEMFIKTGQKYGFDGEKLKIAASNDIDESVLKSLNEQNHKIDIFGIGTNLVTCKKQPALGMVYKMVECDHYPTLKLSEQIEKVTIPGKKRVYRIYRSQDGPFVDVMTTTDEESPTEGKKFLCRHPFIELKKMFIIPTRVEELSKTVKLSQYVPVPLVERRTLCMSELETLRDDHKRLLNPTEYKVSVSDKLYKKMHSMIGQEAPIPTYQ